MTDCPHLMKANNLFWEEWQALTSLPAVVIVCNKDDFSQPCKLMSEFQDSHILCISAFDRVSSVYEGTDKLIWEEGQTSAGLEGKGAISWDFDSARCLGEPLLVHYFLKTIRYGVAQK